MKILTAFILAFTWLTATAQETPTEKAKPIVDEGIRLYKSEMASWYGTDLFLENYKNRDNIGGYISYVQEQAATCIFFSRNENPVVIGSVTFDSSYNTKTAIVKVSERGFTETEKALYTIRKMTLDIVKSDTLFKTYKNTNLNFIPLIYNNERKVYILTGTSQHGTVIFGNDYLLTFSNDNKLLSKKQLHQSFIPITYGAKAENAKEVIGTMHTHLPESGDFITATDICTLMLYATLTKWKQHNVVSKKYLNIWDCEKNHLVVLPMDGGK